MKIAVTLIFLLFTISASAQKEHFELGIEQLQSKEFEKASVSFNEAIKMEPSNPLFFFYLGFSRENLSMTDEAEKAYREAIRLKPDYFEAQYSLGTIFYNRGFSFINTSNEADDFEKANELMQQGKDAYEKALPFMENAYKIRPKDLSTLMALELLYAQLGDEKNHQKIRLELDDVKNGR